MVCAGRFARNYRRCAHVAEWLQPLLQKRRRCCITFRVDAANLPRSVVDVEIGFESIVTGLLDDRKPRRPAVICCDRIHPRRDRPTDEMLIDVRAATQQSLLLAFPESEANRSPGPDAELPKNACGLQHDDA